MELIPVVVVVVVLLLVPQVRKTRPLLWYMNKVCSCFGGEGGHGRHTLYRYIDWLQLDKTRQNPDFSCGRG